ncbi:MAG: hypothetical protein LUK37_23750 [Clostridia bacterium]|nr:hypothetical protein [Clostridia bacterium]
MTYLVMECHPSYAIVLDNEGRIIKAANLGYQEGQVVGEIIAQQTPKAPILFRLAPLAAAACLCLAVLGGGAYGAYGMPYGTVEVRINPDVKMSVSYMDRVVALEGVNEDGKKLIDQVPYKGKDSEYMTGILVERAMEMGYLSEGGTVYVAASGGSERWKEKRADAIRTGLDTLLKDSIPVEIHVESMGKNGAPASAPHHEGGMPGGTGGDKSAFIGVPPGGMSEGDGERDDDKDDGKDDDRDDDGHDDDENDNENDADENNAGSDKDDDREGDADKDNDGDKDDDEKNDDTKKDRNKSVRSKVVKQSSDADDDKDMDDVDDRERDGDDNGDDDGENLDEKDSDEADSDEDGSEEDDSDEEDSGEHGEGDLDEDDRDDDD